MYFSISCSYTECNFNFSHLRSLHDRQVRIAKGTSLRIWNVGGLYNGMLSIKSLELFRHLMRPERAKNCPVRSPILALQQEFVTLGSHTRKCNLERANEEFHFGRRNSWEKDLLIRQANENAGCVVEETMSNFTMLGLR